MKVYTLIGHTYYGDDITDYITCNSCWKNINTANEAKIFVEGVFNRICAVGEVDYIIDGMKKGKTYNEIAYELENDEDVYVPDHDNWYVNILVMNVEDANTVTVMETE